MSCSRALSQERLESAVVNETPTAQNGRRPDELPAERRVEEPGREAIPVSRVYVEHTATQPRRRRDTADTDGVFI